MQLLFNYYCVYFCNIIFKLIGLLSIKVVKCLEGCDKGHFEVVSYSLPDSLETFILDIILIFYLLQHI